MKRSESGSAPARQAGEGSRDRRGPGPAAHPHSSHAMPSRFPVTQSSRMFLTRSHPTARCSGMGREGAGAGGQQPVVAQLWAVTTEAAAVLVRPASSHGLPLGCGGAGGHIPHALVYGGEHTCVTFFPGSGGRESSHSEPCLQLLGMQQG